MSAAPPDMEQPDFLDLADWRELITSPRLRDSVMLLAGCHDPATVAHFVARGWIEAIGKHNPHWYRILKGALQ